MKIQSKRLHIVKATQRAKNRGILQATQRAKNLVMRRVKNQVTQRAKNQGILTEKYMAELKPIMNLIFQ